jgi:hypothetical protein
LKFDSNNGQYTSKCVCAFACILSRIL